MKPLRRCANCKHYLPTDHTEDYGECRRYPPPRPAKRTHIFNGSDDFPIVSETDYCGEFTFALGK